MAFRYVPFDPVSVVARRFAFAHKSALTLQSQLGPSAVRGATPHAARRAEGHLSSSSTLTSALIWTVVLRTPGKPFRRCSSSDRPRRSQRATFGRPSPPWPVSSLWTAPI